MESSLFCLPKASSHISYTADNMIADKCVACKLAEGELVQTVHLNRLCPHEIKDALTCILLSLPACQSGFHNHASDAFNLPSNTNLKTAQHLREFNPLPNMLETIDNQIHSLTHRETHTHPPRPQGQNPRWVKSTDTKPVDNLFRSFVLNL